MNPLIDARRHFLLKFASILAASMGATTACAVSPKLDANAFGNGVASGTPSSDGFVLWTRVFGESLPSSLEVKWQIFEENSDRIVREGISNCNRSLGYSVHVELSGLRPDTKYNYRFEAGGVKSPVGRARTLPTGNIDSVKLAFASCQRWEDGFFAAYEHMLDDDPDYVLFLGDYIYEKRANPKVKSVRTHNLPTAVSLEDFRNRYALYRSDPNLQRMHQACTWIVTWDDHEVENNYAGKSSAYDTHRFWELRANAYQAYYENMPLKIESTLDSFAPDTQANGFRLYKTFDLGKLARIYVLDNRQYRSIPSCKEGSKVKNFEACTDIAAISDSMLGLEQERWLGDRLSESAKEKFKWNVIVQQTRFSPGDYDLGESGNRATDSWDAFPQSRSRLIAQISENNLENVIILGGDIHAHWVAHVHANPYDIDSKKIAVEFIGTSITSISGGTTKSSARKMSKNPHCLYFNPMLRGYGMAQLGKFGAIVSLTELADANIESTSISSVKRFAIKDRIAKAVPIP